MKKRLSDEQLRTLVRARATKGSAFTKIDYESLQREWEVKLKTLTREEIFRKYPLYTFDVKP